MKNKMKPKIKVIFFQFFIPFIFFISILGATYFILTYQLNFTGKIDISSDNSTLNSPISNNDKIQIGLKAKELDIKDLSAVALDPLEEGVVNNLNVPLVVTSLDYIYIPDSYLTQNQQLCIHKLDIESQGIGSSAQNLIDPTLSDNVDLCFNAGQNIVFGEPTVKLIYNKFSKDYIDSYQYPFDRRHINYELILDAYVQDSASNQELFVKLRDVQINIASNEQEVWQINSQEINDEGTALKIESNILRPLKEQILTLSVLISILIVIVILPIITDPSNFWDAFGVFIGLWGIQDIIIPTYIDSNTIVRDLIGRIYILVPLMVLFKLLKNIWENRLLPYFIQPANPGELSGSVAPQDLAIQILSGDKDEKLALELAEQLVIQQIPLKESVSSLTKWARQKISDGIPKNTMAQAFLACIRNTDLTEEQIKKCIAVYNRLS